MTDDAIRTEILAAARTCSDCRVRQVPGGEDVSFCADHSPLASRLDALGQPERLGDVLADIGP